MSRGSVKMFQLRSWNHKNLFRKIPPSQRDQRVMLQMRSNLMPPQCDSARSLSEANERFTAANFIFRDFSHFQNDTRPEQHSAHSCRCHYSESCGPVLNGRVLRGVAATEHGSAWEIKDQDFMRDQSSKIMFHLLRSRWIRTKWGRQRLSSYDQLSGNVCAWIAFSARTQLVKIWPYSPPLSSQKEEQIALTHPQSQVKANSTQSEHSPEH